MKKLLLCFASLSLGVSAQKTPTMSPVKIDPTIAAPKDKTEVNKTPEAIKNVFDTDYPGKTLVTWKVGKKDYRVTYTDPKTNTGHIIFYDKNGRIIRREDEITRKEYPPAITDYYSKKFPGEQFTIWEIEKSPGQKFYYIPREKQAFWFDKEGKFVEKKKIKVK